MKSSQKSSSRNPSSIELDWQKGDGLLPAIIQSETTGEILMLGYMNTEAFDKTLASGHVTFYSRSRQKLWQKGQTSGNTLKLKNWSADCDRDTLLFTVEPQGPTCHLGTKTCFGDNPTTVSLDKSPTDLASASKNASVSPKKASADFLRELESYLQERGQADPQSSYTAKLLQNGVKRIAQKVGEEGLETALAATAGDEKELLNESADLVYHLLVLLQAKNLAWQDVIEVLRSRHRL